MTIACCLFTPSPSQCLCSNMLSLEDNDEQFTLMSPYNISLQLDSGYDKAELTLTLRDHQKMAFTYPPGNYSLTYAEGDRKMTFNLQVLGM